MTTVNIAAASSIIGTTTYLTPSGTSAVVLLNNTATSAAVYKINQIVAANVNGSAAVNTTVSIYSNGAQTQGNAPSSGTAYPIASVVSVPPNASLIVADKTTAIYLMEGQSITVTSGDRKSVV